MLNGHTPKAVPGPACGAFADLLPLLGEALLREAEARQVRAHLATCAYCQREYAAYRRIEANLRQHFGGLPSLRFSPEDIMALIEDTPPAGEGSNNSTSAAAPPAPLRRKRRVVSLVSLVAAALVVVVVAVLVGRNVLPNNTQAAQPVVTSAPPPGVLYQPLSTDYLAAVQMLSATEGWVGGTSNLTYGGLNVTGDPLIVQYHGGQWWRSPTPSAAQLGLDNAQIESISMVSANDGWAVGYGSDFNNTPYAFILHYSGGKWTLSGSTMRYGGVYQVQMLSPTNGWITGDSSDPNLVAAKETHLMLHYDEKHWALVPMPVGVYSLDMLSATDGWVSGDGEMLHYDGHTWAVFQRGIGIGPLSLDSATDGWAAEANPQGAGTVVFWHYDGHTWVQRSLTVNNGDTHPSGVEVSSLVMDSATDGWALGAEVFQTPPSTTSSALYLHYTQGRWTQVQGPQVKNLGAVSMVSANEGWAVGSNMSVTSNGQLLSGGAVLLHYLNGTWTQYKF